MFFYAVFAMLYFTGRLALGLAAWTAAIILASLAGITIVPLALINLEFVFGILVAVAVARGHGSRWRYLASAAAFAAWLALGGERPMSPLVGLAFAFAILPTIRLEREGRFAVPAWLLLLGAASYALYLTHGLAISVVGRFVPSVPLILVIGMVESIVVGLGYFWLIEKPLLRLIPVPRRPSLRLPPLTGRSSRTVAGE